MLDKNTSRWLMGGMFLIIISLIATIFSFTVTAEDIKDFVTRAEAKELIRTTSPYVADERDIKTQLTDIKATLTKIEFKLETIGN